MPSETSSTTSPDTMATSPNPQLSGRKQRPHQLRPGGFQGLTVWGLAFLNVGIDQQDWESVQLNMS